MSVSWRIILCLGLSPIISYSSLAQLSLQAELGALFQSRNDVEIPPNDDSTRVEIDSFDRGPFFHYRIDGSYEFSKKHGIRFVYAPFDQVIIGEPVEPISFNEVNFAADTETEFRYKFNSYRLGYFYSFTNEKFKKLRLGFTGKIREAVTEVKQGSLTSSYDNRGFVPLLFFEYQTPLSQRLYFNFNFDGLAGGPGRAFDVAAKVRALVNESSHIGVGYRTLEGGADTDEVFAFSWFNYVVLDYFWQF